MIFGRWGDVITILRVATLADVKKHERRTPDSTDKRMVRESAYLMVRYNDSGEESIMHRAYIRADGGLAELDAAVAATKAP